MEQDDAFHLTAVDVRRYEFQTVMRGYDRARVDQFKQQVADEMERLMRANQELDEKAKELADLPDLRWHFIGHLQSNKAKLVAPVAHLVHAVDSPSLASALARRAPHRLRVLVEVNVAGEAEKHGAAPADVGALLDAIEKESNLELAGLMTMPPHDLDAAKRAFEDLVKLRDRYGGAARLPELSMGMSDDLEIAIACGATLVRVGTAIFGAREYPA